MVVLSLNDLLSVESWDRFPGMSEKPPSAWWPGGKNDLVLSIDAARGPRRKRRFLMSSRVGALIGAIGPGLY
jgi:hypothetical protein